MGRFDLRDFEWSVIEPLLQVQAPGTPVIPTRKIVDFLGIRAMEGRDEDLSGSLATTSYRLWRSASGKIPLPLSPQLRVCGVEASKPLPCACLH